MKHVDLIRRLQRAARAAGRDFRLVREGGADEVRACGGTQVVVARHREMNDRTAGHIMRELEPEFGEGRWKR